MPLASTKLVLDFPVCGRESSIFNASGWGACQERDYSHQDITQLFAFIDWLISLPIELNATLWQEVREYREESKMRYITSLEQFAAAEAREKALVEGREEGLEAGREAGLEEGRQEGIVEGLKGGLILTLDLAYGEEGLAIAQEVEKINDIKILQSLRDGLKNRKSLAELRQLYAPDN